MEAKHFRVTIIPTTSAESNQITIAALHDLIFKKFKESFVDVAVLANECALESKDVYHLFEVNPEGE